MFTCTCRLLFLSLVLFIATETATVSCFVVVAPFRFSKTRIVLAAAKGRKFNKKKTSSNSGGGFASSTSSNNNSQVRSVSGFTGSGTKPLRVAANTFDRLRKEYDKDCLNDVYVRSPLNDESTYWFVGKIARCLEKQDCQGTCVPTPQEAVLSQKRLILEYAKRELRPQNLGGPYEKALELWLAPGDSEMDTVQNKVTLEKVEGSTSKSLRDGFSVADVGFNPEIYVGDEVTKGGLRVTRDSEGRPTKPVFEINESS